MQYLPTILDILTLLAIILAVYKYFRDPDVSAKTEIELLKQACRLKHSNLDDYIGFIKNNHLAHLEKDVAEIKNNQTKIFTILEERLPTKR